MKIKLLLLSASVLSGSVFLSCNDDDDTTVENQAVQTSFASMYPGATSVEWETKSGYTVADFILDNEEAEAWYDESGIWYLTETDITFNALPDEVKTAFSSGNYASWQVDDVDLLERKDMEPVYVIEVENGGQEYDLYYTADGTLVKEVPDDGSEVSYLPPAISETIETFIEENYPGAGIVETDYEDGALEVDILDGTVYRELKFNTSGEWVYTKTEITLDSVPEAVSTALAASQYAGWQVDDVDLYNTPEGDYYRFELEQGDSEVYLKISPEGTIL